MKETIYQIDCKSAAGVQAIVNFLESRGFKSSNGFNAANYLVHYSEYHWLVIKPYLKHWGGNPHSFSSHTTITFEEFFSDTDKYALQSISVVLNGKYTASVTKESIKVGCAEFPIDILEKLNAAYAKLRG